jgi:hypothetical protein
MVVVSIIETISRRVLRQGRSLLDVARRVQSQPKQSRCARSPCHGVAADLTRASRPEWRRPFRSSEVTRNSGGDEHRSDLHVASQVGRVIEEIDAVRQTLAPGGNVPK